MDVVAASLEQLQACSQLVTRLSVRFEVGRNAGAMVVLEAVCRRASRLSSLDLSDTGLGDDFPEALVGSSLRSLVLSNNRLTNVGALRLAALVAGRARGLVSLSVSANAIGDDGAMALCK